MQICKCIDCEFNIDGFQCQYETVELGEMGECVDFCEEE